MTVSKLLEEAEKAFHDMDWKKLMEINKEIIASGPDEKIEKLANGFCHYAKAKLGEDKGKVISNLEKAGEYFKPVDAYLASMADIERLILLSEFDEKNRTGHLMDLANLAQDLFIKSGDSANLQIAIDALGKAKTSLGGEEQVPVIIGLQFCHGSYAWPSKSPAEHYALVVELHEELETGDSATLATSMMNAAISCQNLAFLKEGEAGSIEKAIKLNEGAIEIFETKDSKIAIVKAKQCLSNILKDAAKVDSKNAKKHIEKAIILTKEVMDLFREEGFEADSAFVSLEIGIAHAELAALDMENSDSHFKSAIESFREAADAFEEGEDLENLGHAKAGIAAVYKTQGAFEDAVKMYEGAIALFKDPVFLGRTRQNLAAALRDLAKETGEQALIKKAEKLEGEAAESLN